MLGLGSFTKESIFVDQGKLGLIPSEHSLQTGKYADFYAIIYFFCTINQVDLSFSVHFVLQQTREAFGTST